MSHLLLKQILPGSCTLSSVSATSRKHCIKGLSRFKADIFGIQSNISLANYRNAIRSFSATRDSGFKPWYNQVVQSDGDYRKENFLEGYIGGPLYENQNNLPRLPIPSIEETLDRFLPTALPLAKSEEEVRALRNACDAFPEQAKILQERLERRSKEEMEDSSWLQLWWNQLAYLQYRSSVVVNVSYFFHFKDDPTLRMGEINSSIQRAATLLFATGEYRKSVCSGSMPQETIGKKNIPICSTPFKYLFNACRIPKAKQDSYYIYDPSRYSHAIVARKGHFFAIEIVHPETGEPLPIEALEEQLQECVDQADKIPKDQHCLGLLTSTNRDSWTSAREKLLEAGGAKMKLALEMIESGAVMVNLDEGTPLSRDECCEMLLTGGITNGKNRWFDKSIQLIVAENGKSGILGEHSMMDGMVMVSYCDHLTNTSYADAVERSKARESAPSKVVNIFGNIKDTIGSKVLDPLVEAATTEFEELIAPQANRAQSFHGYGSSYIKKAGHSPDAFVQMAMQLATYRLFGEQVGTYEATQVRPFLHGRTETTRAVSVQSESFIKAMGLRPKEDEGDQKKRRLKLELLKEATSAHSTYTATAGQALGVDRHFFGLSMLLEDGEKTPDLLGDPVFIRSKTWRLSTSHLTHPNFVNWGFGQVVPDGVGVGYSIHAESCIFNITALEETNWTLKLSALLEEVLLEMKALIDKEEEGDAS